MQSKMSSILWSALKNYAIAIVKSARKGVVRQVLHYITAGHIFKVMKIWRWNNSTTRRYVQIGGGVHKKKGREWINGDLIDGDIYLNAAKTLPFADDSIDLIFTEQFIEHLNQSEALFFLKESYRVLKKGGIIRQSTPDLVGIIDVYMDRNTHVSQFDVIDRHINNHRKNQAEVQRKGCQFFNDMFRLWGHKFIYDELTLISTIQDAGFRDIIKVKFGEYGFNEFTSGLERHADHEWMKHAFVMIFEARK